MTSAARARLKNGTALTGVLLLYLIFSSPFHAYISDDAYISLRYAAHWAEGFGPVWNPGERGVDGYSNFLWVALHAGVFAWGVTRDAITHVLTLEGVAWGAASIVALFYAFGRGAVGTRLFACLVFALSPPLLIWSGAGLETAFFAFLLILAVRPPLDGWPFLTPMRAVVLGLAALTRTEGIVYAACLGAWDVFVHWRGVPWEERVRRSLVPGIILTTIVGGYAVWRAAYYDGVLPNAVVAKGALFSGLESLGADLRTFWPLTALALASLVRVRRWPLTLLYLVTAGVLGVIIAQAHPAAAMWHRHFLPIVVLLVFAARPALEWLADNVGKGARAARLAGALLCLFLLGWPLRHYPGYIEGVRLEAQGVALYEDIGRWLGETMPPETSIALMDCGAIPFYARMRTLDLWGLNDYHTARDGVTRDYVRRRDPDVFVFVSTSINDPTPRSAAERLIFSAPDFQTRYTTIRSDHLPGAQFAVWVWRKQSEKRPTFSSKELK